ncbi:MAG: double-strand break repair helicase AddA [Pseudomonadota bacterium]
MTPAERTTERQRSAADPAKSVFVMANAGSGKTRVLTSRVARLLLRDINPQQILCITFTKAAAAEMGERLFEMLGEWALMPDDELRAALAKLEGDDAPARSSAELGFVRRLFARALETPGGLKIQTIHAFCEAVLRRFPIEAGVAPGFTVIEDVEGQDLANAALDAVAMGALDDHRLADDFAALTRLKDEEALRKLSTKEARAGLRHQLRNAEGAQAALRAALGIETPQSAEEIVAPFVESISRGQMAAAASALKASGGNPAKRAPYADQFLNAQDAIGQFDALRGLCLKVDDTPPDNIVTKATDAIDASVRPFLDALKDEVAALLQRMKAAALYENAAAFNRVLSAVRNGYEAMKAQDAALDFDDLILKTRALLKREDAAWVRYKLDFGIDHILLDEAQDTSDAQWRVIEALIEDYLSGASGREEPRSFFAVGDVKQSIYSFQGADAAVFEGKEADLGKRLAAYHHEIADGDYAHVGLDVSFRTTEPILRFVDAVFADREIADALGRAGPPRHISGRPGEAGLVELWPLAPYPDKPKPSAWDAPVDAPGPDDPVERLATRVADEIARWDATNEKLASRDRAIRPGDIMILVQSRGRLFDAVLRALARKQVPVAGADRLKLLEDPGVEDLISFAKFCVQPRDDLSLAETLKSPLFGFGDDEDLFPLANGRARGETLWRRLASRADQRPRWRAAADAIRAAKKVSEREGAFAFLSAVLDGTPGADGRTGRQRFYARLGPGARDAIDELLRLALDYERAFPRSTRGFANWIGANAGEIKREMDRTDDAVRVMTVHAAKGLEANIVFLLDAHRHAQTKDIGDPLAVETAPDEPPVHLLAGGQARDIPATAAAREEKKRAAFEEHRRLFYVAATRARDRLYVAGVQLGNDKSPRNKPLLQRSWHTLACDAFDRLEDDVETLDPLWPETDAPALRLSCPQSAAIESETSEESAAPPPPPDWLLAPAKRETPRLRLAPSRLADAEEVDVAPQPAESAAFSPTGIDRYRRGRVLHRLLELLPDLAPGDRPAAADRLLAAHAGDLGAAIRAEWRDEVMTVLSDSAFADVFGAGAKAEAAIAGEVNGRFVVGQIDRLLIEKTRILAVDYKTNRPPPRRVEDTPAAYLAQMAAYRALLQEIYPGRQIDCALLWTFEARLAPLPQSLLDGAAARWLATG